MSAGAVPSTESSPEQLPVPAKAPRDWPLVAAVACVFSAALAGLYLLQDWAWKHAQLPPPGPIRVISTVGQLLWCVPVVLGVAGLAGMLMQRKAVPVSPDAPPLPNTVVFRYVTRGTNNAVLCSAVQSVVKTMAAVPLFPYAIEVITETPQDGLPPEVTERVVPSWYFTQRGSRWKARALQYAVEQSHGLPDDAWVFHCDEESHLTRSVVRGIYQAVGEEEATGQHRVGQGTIVYLHSLRAHPFFTLADSVRTGDDVGRFHLQNRVWHLPVVGFHGSFILVRQSVERRAGFDVGPEGSITEDAFWTLILAGHGVRCRWVDGYVVEQSPGRIIDFVRQRRRWYRGLIKTVRHAPVSWRLRLPLGIFTALWTVSWVTIVYTYIEVAMGWRAVGPIQAIGDVAFACYIVIYVIGLHVALRAHVVQVGPLRKAVLYAGQVAGMLLFALLEAAGVVFALATPRAYSDKQGFYVMPKRCIVEDAEVIADEPADEPEAVPAAAGE